MWVCAFIKKKIGEKMGGPPRSSSQRRRERQDDRKEEESRLAVSKKKGNNKEEHSNAKENEKDVVEDNQLDAALGIDDDAAEQTQGQKAVGKSRSVELLEYIASKRSGIRDEASVGREKEARVPKFTCVADIMEFASLDNLRNSKWEIPDVYKYVTALDPEGDNFEVEFADTYGKYFIRHHEKDICDKLLHCHAWDLMLECVKDWDKDSDESMMLYTKIQGCLYPKTQDGTRRLSKGYHDVEDTKNYYVRLALEMPKFNHSTGGRKHDPQQEKLRKQSEKCMRFIMGETEVPCALRMISIPNEKIRFLVYNHRKKMMRALLKEISLNELTEIFDWITPMPGEEDTWNSKKVSK